MIAQRSIYGRISAFLGSSRQTAVSSTKNDGFDSSARRRSADVHRLTTPLSDDEVDDQSLRYPKLDRLVVPVRCSRIVMHLSNCPAENAETANPVEHTQCRGNVLGVDPLISGKQNFFIQGDMPSVGAKAPEIACAIDFPAPERPNAPSRPILH